MKVRYEIILLFIFSTAMAYVEASIVVYLRIIYYPEGFQFPLKLIPQKILLIEIGRELSTIIMLFAISSLCGKLLIEKFFYFIYAFGVWDIFYYVWLKLFLNWPPSLLTDDILFLIPVPWIAPVLAPIIISIDMITFSFISLYAQRKGYFLKTNKLSNILFVLGIVIVLFSFMWDFSTRSLTAPPIKFLWEFFIAGELLITAGFILFLKRLRKIN